jgi:hypothetical protein
MHYPINVASVREYCLEIMAGIRRIWNNEHRTAIINMSYISLRLCALCGMFYKHLEFLRGYSRLWEDSRGGK